ncbi:hypothetical protein HPP92_028970 [Vanilla planifolia]|uniref:Uncharacterized protein n=1 Tax=Vanilla planifolia TaxID=51239 RepID=A0A835U390_VANPL|nr:hypothetical protein HPP92_028970 [Vanilla planifolia]KAG0446170.1 hypothetical protein HPP92_028959 [Vanilla planifolia]
MKKSGSTPSDTSMELLVLKGMVPAPYSGHFKFSDALAHGSSSLNLSARQPCFGLRQNSLGVVSVAFQTLGEPRSFGSVSLYNKVPFSYGSGESQLQCPDDPKAVTMPQQSPQQRSRLLKGRLHIISAALHDSWK